MRLIDADMIEPHEQLEPLGNGKYEFALVVYMDDIDALPSVDAVPVVRCADCIWMQCNMNPDGTLPKGVDEYECRHWCGACDPTDFCSYGERKDAAD